MGTMTLTRRVHLLIDPAQFAGLEEIARSCRKATGENTTLGGLIREAISDLLTKHQEPSAAPRPTRRHGLRKRSTSI
jgi:hypothetical protein